MTNKQIIFLIVILLYISALGSFFVFGGFDMPKVRSEQVQAVFLVDGQVYFGRLKNYNRRFVELSNVYYLKYGNTLQQNKSNETQTNSNQNLNLVKLGGEVHGPENIMYIAKDKIVFIENLKNSSTVVQAIRNNIK